ncbi:hypothetical protein [Marinicellulosiphila megalodicopiae]|uniref:hypothetical protein n=1 Tax=Marinicellulosiphila megalodicopiae TaxID=2724896 RepID=UPI003BAF6A33
MKIYLDQNVLTELRPRKLNQNLNEVKDIRRAISLKILNEFLKYKEVDVCYSHIHLEEIDQIELKDKVKQEGFKEEHIELLDSFNAKFLDAELIYNEDSVRRRWNNFLQNKQDNTRSGFDDIADVMDQSMRGLMGLNTLDPVMNNLLSLLEKAKEMQLSTVDSFFEKPNEYNELLDVEMIRQSISNEIDSQIKNMKPEMFEKIDSVNFTSKEMREENKVKVPDLHLKEESEVVDYLIEKLSFDELEAIQEDTFKKGMNTENRIVMLYNLLNSVDYCRDKYDQINKKYDGFRASKYDGYHISKAYNCDFIISNDKGFLQKGNAIFKSKKINKPCIICTSEEFITKYIDWNDERMNDLLELNWPGHTKNTKITINI